MAEKIHYDNLNE